MQTDPIGYMAGLNLYVYCGNSPAMWIDPLGQDSTESECPSSSDKKWGLSLTWPAVNAYLPILGPGIEFGHEFVWIPGERGRSYFYVQGGWGGAWWRRDQWRFRPGMEYQKSQRLYRTLQQRVVHSIRHTVWQFRR